MIKKFKDIEGELDKIREAGTPRGDSTGFKTMDEFFTVKQGSYTFILGSPHQGKSEIAFEIMFNQATRHRKKGLISSSETGSVAEIYAEFIHKYTGKVIYKDSFNSIKDVAYYDAVRWVDENFSIIDSEDQTYSFGEIFDMCTDEKIILLDPYNEHKHDMSGYGSRQDLFIEDEIGDVRRFCKKKNKHAIITLHPASQQMKEGFVNKKKIRYYPMPVAREAAGGQALFRKAMTWINIWRPTSGLTDTKGRYYSNNELVVVVEKAKPKGVAKKGQFSLYFDEDSSRFYEMLGTVKAFSFQHEKMTNLDIFTTEEDTSPF